MVLSAKTDHAPRLGNIRDSLPVVYVGDTSVLRFVRHSGDAAMIVAAFESAELHHKLEILGDYQRCVLARSRLEPQSNVSREWPKQ